MTRVLRGLTWVVPALVVACSGGGEPSTVCTPDEVRDCTCRDGTVGQQECTNDGSRWGACYPCAGGGNGGTSSSSGTSGNPATSSSSGGNTTSRSSSSSAGGQPGSSRVSSSSGGGGGITSSGGAMTGAVPVVSVTSDRATFGSGTSSVVTFTATVTDADGQGDIADVFLTDTTGAHSYGVMTRFSENTWRLGLSWNQINTADPITLPAGGGPRTFRAYALDRASNRGFGDTNVTLQCYTTTNGACAGECVDFTWNTEHCGRCNNPTNGLECVNGTIGCGPLGDEPQMQCGGMCVRTSIDENNCGTCGYNCNSRVAANGWSTEYVFCSDTICQGYPRVSQSTTCNSVCGSRGWVCASGWGEYASGTSVRVGCDEAPPPTLTVGNETLTATECSCFERQFPPYEMRSTGTACTTSSDCPYVDRTNSSCISASSYPEFPGGMCYTGQCRLDTECGLNGRCVNVSPSTTPEYRCLLDCGAGCRSGYQCMNAPNAQSGRSNVCYGTCSTRNPCPRGMTCSNGTCQ